MDNNPAQSRNEADAQPATGGQVADWLDTVDVAGDNESSGLVETRDDVDDVDDEDTGLTGDEAISDMAAREADMDLARDAAEGPGAGD